MIDLREMLKAGIHFGHKTSRWCPRMRPFIWGAKNKVHLIDVSKTALLLEKAGKYINAVTSEGGVFLWIGTKKPAQAFIQKIATDLGMPWVIHRWVGGTLSNHDQVKKAMTRLLHLRDVVKRGGTHYKKKEIVMINKEIARLEKNVGGILDLEYPPAGIILVDAKKEHAVIREASKIGIPVIALVDTNTDPEGVSFIIPGNDDSPRSINFVLEYLAKQAQDGKKTYVEMKEKEKQEQIEAKKQSRAKELENRAKEAEIKAQQIKEAAAKHEAAKAHAKTHETAKPVDARKHEAHKEELRKVDVPGKAEVEKTAPVKLGEVKKHTPAIKEAAPAKEATAKHAKKEEPAKKETKHETKK